MTQQMPNEEIDTAIILEGEIKRRVAQVVEKVVVNMVGKIIHEELNKYKAEMLMEVSINVGKMLRVVENEGRKPLWESTPEEFGLTREELNRSSMGRSEEETDYAIR
jgi:hypothetical protein